MMGSSPKDDYTAPARQGPPEEQVTPAQPPPKYANFLDRPNAEGMMTWDDAAMSKAIADAGASNAASTAAMFQQQPSSGQGGRAALASTIAQGSAAASLPPAARAAYQQAIDAGDMGRARAILEQFSGGRVGGERASSPGPSGPSGWGGGVAGGVGGRSSGGLY